MSANTQDNCTFLINEEITNEFCRSRSPYRVGRKRRHRIAFPGAPYCIGRNYLAHIRELGNDERKPPFFFQKLPDALVPSGTEFPYPPQSDNVHHEIELVVAIAKGGKDIAIEDALNHVYGYGLGIDMTRRDQQNKAKTDGKP